eukprot:Amastigsp_a339418_595.p1 type:complete len:445 gc:universal Amastigsp_a339418_595:1356-22(-)
MKVKVLSRSETAFTKETSGDLQKVHRNLAPELHTFERAREFKSALNAAKLDRIFAKPFVGQLEGHSDSVTALARSWRSLPISLSGAADGELRVWNIATRKSLWRMQAHQTQVSGIAAAPDGESFFSASLDRTVKRWRISLAGDVVDVSAPSMTYAGRYTFHSIDHNFERPLFVTGSRQIDIWDPTRSEPTTTFAWGDDSINCARWNPVETDVIAATSTDRAITLYDVRTQSPIRKVIMEMSCNGLSWNPIEAMNFTAACEDHRLYTFDMRRLDSARVFHEDHVAAVIDVDYSPTGQEFVTGGYDCSVRIFREGEGHSREVYFTKRMQRVLSVRFSLDAQYVLSGSDDSSVRIWKAEASKERGILRPRQEAAHKYREKLVKRFESVPIIRKITKHRNLPRAIYSAKKLRSVMLAAAVRKEERRRQHSAPKPFVAERKKHVVAEVE